MHSDYNSRNYLQKEGVSVMHRLSIVVLLLGLFLCHVIALGRVTEERTALPRGEGSGYILPSSILKITSLDFDGLASDFLFLKAITFIGGTYERKESPDEKKSEMRWLYNVLDTATDLDPYFIDPYYLANAYLLWNAGMVQETNVLLEKGSRYRDWDWMLPFFIGFNHFYFLHDNDKASEYLMQAARRPGAQPFLASFASRLAYRGRKTENAIIFLEEILGKTQDEAIRKRYETRIEALKAILYLENSVELYKKRFKKNPTKIDELLKKQIIKELPRDPYGGRYYIDAQGNVRSTSEYQLDPYQASR